AETADALGLGQVPNGDGLAGFPGGRDGPPVRGERQAGEGTGVLPGLQGPARGGGPDPQRPVIPDRGEPLAGGGEGDSVDGGLVPQPDRAEPGDGPLRQRVAVDVERGRRLPPRQRPEKEDQANEQRPGRQPRRHRFSSLKGGSGSPGPASIAE